MITRHGDGHGLKRLVPETGSEGTPPNLPPRRALSSLPPGMLHTHTTTVMRRAVGAGAEVLLASCGEEIPARRLCSAACLCACVRARACVCVRACVRACVRVWVGSKAATS